MVAVPAKLTLGLGTTVTDELEDATSEQMLPASRNMAWYRVVPTVVLADIEVVVLAMVVHVVPLSVEYSQRIIFPD